MRDEYGFTHAEVGKYAERMQVGHSTPTNRGSKRQTENLILLAGVAGQLQPVVRGLLHRLVAVDAVTIMLIKTIRLKPLDKYPIEHNRHPGPH